MVRGRLAVTRLAGERALTLSADASADRERAHFFRGASRALTDEYDGGLAELKALDRSKLPERDVPLLNATVQLALDVRKPIAGGSAADAADKPPLTPARLDLASSTATACARAAKQLGELELLTKDRSTMTKLNGTSGQLSRGLAESLNVRGTSRSARAPGEIAGGLGV